MLKNILKLEGAQKLTKNEQKSIKGSGRGGNPCCDPELSCCIPNGYWDGVNGCRFISSFENCI
jgi:hypothetical protein